MRPSSFLRALLALCFVLVPSGGHTQAPVTDRRISGAATCRVETPAAWTGGSVVWLGGCKGGYADGLGVLRRTLEGGTPAELFLGRVDRGTLGSGVLDTGLGYMAGRWRAGALDAAASDDPAVRNDLLAAYREAAKAADTTAKVMARRSNAKSARFYRRLAKRLRLQMDD